MIFSTAKRVLSPPSIDRGDIRTQTLIVPEGASVNGKINVEAPLSPAGVFAEMAPLMKEEQVRAL